VPDDATLLNANVYRFSDGTVHHLRRARPKSADHRWHRNLVFGCELCFPPKPQPPPPVVEQLLAQEVQPPEKLPEIIIEAEIEDDESELKSLTILSAAFGRVSKRNSR